MLSNLELINKTRAQVDHDDQVVLRSFQAMDDTAEYYNIQQQPSLQELADELNMEAFIGDEALIQKLKILNTMKYKTKK
jgi:hypothetical protein